MQENHHEVVQLIGTADVMHVLERISMHTDQEIVHIQCTGSVTGRRVQKSHIFVSIQMGPSNNNTDVLEVQLVVSGDQLKSEGKLSERVNHVRVGARVACMGVAKCDRPGSLSVYVQELTLAQCSPEPEAIRRYVVSTLGRDGDAISDACACLACDAAQLTTLQALAAGGSSKAKEFKQAIAKHSRVMLGKPSRRSRQREHRVSRCDMEVLERAEASIMLWTCSSDPSSGGDDVDAVGGSPALCAGCGYDEEYECNNDNNEEKDEEVCTAQGVTLNVPDGLHDLPSARGPMSRGEYMHGRKEPQIRWFARQMRSMGSFTHVLDIGGGRGDLAVHIAQCFPHILVTVVDANQRSLQQGQEHAARQGRNVASRVRFVCARVTEDDVCLEAIAIGNSEDSGTEDQNHHASSTTTADGTPTETALSSASLPPMDFVVALHACGGLSDLALRHAVLHRCKFLVCPCCYLKTPYVLSASTMCAPSSGGGSAAAAAASASALSEAGRVKKDNRIETSEEAAGQDDDTPMLRDEGRKEMDQAISPTLTPAPQLAQEDRLTLLRLAESDNRAVSLRASRVINSQRLATLQAMMKTIDAADQLDPQKRRSECDTRDVATETKTEEGSLHMLEFSAQFSLRNTVLGRF